MEKLSIVPIHVGTCLNVEKSNFTCQVDQGIKISAAMLMDFIRGTKENIIVDTGASEPALAEKYHYPFIQTEEQKPLNALAHYGIDPDSVTLVINTHLHWDHCYNNDLFRNALIIVQLEEIRYAISPLPYHSLAYETHQLKMTPPWMKSYDRIEIVDGDKQIVPGVFVMKIPGHSPGNQAVCVECQGGTIAIVSDLCPLFENWEGNLMLDRIRADHIPPGYHVNLEDVYKSFKKIETVTNFILPGHDIKVLEKVAYP